MICSGMSVVSVKPTCSLSPPPLASLVVNVDGSSWPEDCVGMSFLMLVGLLERAQPPYM